MDIKGKRVLITGGSSGIGLALAHALGQEGARIAISGRRADALSEAVAHLRDACIEAYAVAADVSTPSGRQATLVHALEALGGVDVLVNNAGGVRGGRLEHLTEAEIRTMIEVDLIAPILLTQAALPSLRENESGLVVNVTSGAALIGMPFYSTYAAAKAGLMRFGEALRRELTGEGIHVMTVYPGATDTPMMRTSHAGPELGFARESPVAVADAIVEGIKGDALEVIRGGEARSQMIALNRDDPTALDQRFASIKDALAKAVRDHSAL
jgi:short-subunit dehydrogenase